MPNISNQQLVKDFFKTTEALLNTSRTMQDIFLLSTKQNEKNTAVAFFDSRNKLIKYKYSEMRTKAYETASKLAKFLVGQPKKGPIILKLSNSATWINLFWAILMCGHTPLLLDAKLPEENTNNMIKQSKAIAIITNDEHEYKILKLSVEEINEEKAEYKFAETWADEVIFCSSGTTGDAKLMIFNGECLCKQIYSATTMPDVTQDIMYPNKLGQLNILAMMPFHHIFGFVAVFLWYSFFGKTLVFTNSLAPNEIMNVCQKCSITHLYSVPLFWDGIAQYAIRSAALLGEKRVKTLDTIIGYNTGKISRQEAGNYVNSQNLKSLKNSILGNSIRYCISGGGFISNRTLTIINGLGYPLYNGFGMTELGVTSVELRPQVTQRLKGSIGKPLTGVVYKILPQQGKNKNCGELLVKADFMHIREVVGGVSKSPELTEDGFLKTGDIGEKDATGSFYILGRIKDVIISTNGENIYPDEIESYFKKLQNVANLCVLGIKDKRSGQEKITLVLELNGDVKDKNLDAIKNEVRQINESLPANKRVEVILIAKNHLPIANNMKVKRYVLKTAIEEKKNDYIDVEAKPKTKNFEGFDPLFIESIIEPTRTIFADVLLLPKFKLSDSGHWINDLGGDSMSYIQLINDLEECFKVKIPEEKYGLLTCINDFVEEIANLKQNK